MASREEEQRGLGRAPSGGEVVQSRKRVAREEIDEGPSEEDVERFGDVTRSCPECGKDVFDDAAVCYHCGYAFERTTEGSTKSKTWVVAVVIVVVIAFVALALGGLW